MSKMPELKPNMLVMDTDGCFALVNYVKKDGTVCGYDLDRNGPGYCYLCIEYLIEIDPETIVAIFGQPDEHQPGCYVPLLPQDIDEIMGDMFDDYPGLGVLSLWTKGDPSLEED